MGRFRDALAQDGLGAIAEIKRRSPSAGRIAAEADSVVARFASDSEGHFLVYVAPGTYLVVPDEPIGIGLEALEATVEGGGLTHVDLTFDTGIR